MSDSPDPGITSIFEAARLGWQVKLTCWHCGHVRILHAAALWLTLSMKGAPDDLGEVRRYAKCLPCLNERREKIGGPKVELVRDRPTGEPLRLPTEREWKEGLRRQRR